MPPDHYVPAQRFPAPTQRRPRSPPSRAGPHPAPQPGPVHAACSVGRRGSVARVGRSMGAMPSPAGRRRCAHHRWAPCPLSVSVAGCGAGEPCRSLGAVPVSRAGRWMPRPSAEPGVGLFCWRRLAVPVRSGSPLNRGRIRQANRVRFMRRARSAGEVRSRGSAGRVGAAPPHPSGCAGAACPAGTSGPAVVRSHAGLIG